LLRSLDDDDNKEECEMYGTSVLFVAVSA